LTLKILIGNDSSHYVSGGLRVIRGITPPQDYSAGLAKKTMNKYTISPINDWIHEGKPKESIISVIAGTLIFLAVMGLAVFVMTL
jgi:hypothetical protein